MHPTTTELHERALAVIEGRRYHGRGHGLGMYLNLRPGKQVTPC